jgi:radical SAM superfamily enzyme YgiQ (UPF0313 family)
VVIGEAESAWPEVLKDFKAGTLKPFYKGEQGPMVGLPTPLYGMLKHGHDFRIVNTARGCPYQCSFCTVNKYFGAKIRMRPIDEVVRDVDLIPGGMYINGDENIWWLGKVDRAIELFTALRGSKKKWMGFGSLAPVLAPEGPAMLKAARASGMLTVWVGWESISDAGVVAYGADRKVGKDRERAVKTLKDHGIDVSLFFMLGSRADSIDDYKYAVDVADRLGVSMHPSLVVPYPGTELRKQYEPYLYKDLGWEYYTGAYALFEHPDPAMTPEVRERLFYESSLELLSLPRVLKHMFKVPASGFPHAHILSLMNQLPVRTGMKIAFEKWKRESGSVRRRQAVAPASP